MFLCCRDSRITRSGSKNSKFPLALIYARPLQDVDVLDSQILGRQAFSETDTLELFRPGPGLPVNFSVNKR